MYMVKGLAYDEFRLCLHHFCVKKDDIDTKKKCNIVTCKEEREHEDKKKKINTLSVHEA